MINLLPGIIRHLPVFLPFGTNPIGLQCTNLAMVSGSGPPIRPARHSSAMFWEMALGHSATEGWFLGVDRRTMFWPGTNPHGSLRTIPPRQGPQIPDRDGTA